MAEWQLLREIEESCKPGTIDRLMNWFEAKSIGENPEFLNDRQEFQCLDAKTYYQLRAIDRNLHPEEYSPAGHHSGAHPGHPPVTGQPPAHIGRDGSIKFGHTP